MTGQIPKYGANFKHDRVNGYHPALSHAIYVLKIDDEWFIRSDRTSKRWYLFRGMIRDQATSMGKVQPSLTRAMQLMLAGIEGGFYVTRQGVHAQDCGLQGSGLDKRRTCPVDNPVS